MLRQHRDHPVREIHRRCARPRLDVEFAAGTHVVAHVGDRDDEAPAAPAARLRIHGVVEVLGVGAVDRHERQLAQILASGQVRRFDVRAEAVRGAQDFGRKLLRQIVAQHRKACREVRWTQVLEHLDDATLSRILALGTLRDLDDHVVLVFGAVAVAQRYFDRIPVTRILGRDAAATGACVPDAADAFGRIADAPDEPRHAPAAVVDADGAHFDPIVMHERCRVGAREHERCRAVVGHDQNFAAGASAHPARNSFGLARSAEAVLALQCLSVAHHGGKPLAERVALRVRREAESLGKTRRAQGLGSFSQVLEQQFAARNRFGIARFLQLQVGIFAAPIIGAGARTGGSTSRHSEISLC